jgi:hypothetical protein
MVVRRFMYTASSRGVRAALQPPTTMPQPDDERQRWWYRPASFAIGHVDAVRLLLIHPPLPTQQP